MEVLICRLRPWMAFEIAKNLSAQGHGVHTIDYGQLSEYKKQRIFKSCHLWKHHETPVEMLERKFRNIVINYNISIVIIAQKLFLYSNVAEKVCRELKIKVVFAEAFFDDKLIFDDIGLQYTKENQSVGICDAPISYTRQGT